MGLLDSLLSKVGFVRYSNGDTFYKIGNTSYLNGQYMKIALSNPVLFACIEIRAKALSKVRFYQEDSNGNEIEDSNIIKILNNPNSHQSKQDFLKQYEWYKSVYGWVYQKPYKSAIGKDVKALFNLDSSRIEFPKQIKSSIVFSKQDIKDFNSQKIKYKELNQTNRSFEFSEIIPFYDITNGVSTKLTTSITSPSRVDAVIKSVSNIKLSTDAENIMIQQNGREMFWGAGNKSSNLGSTLPMHKDDRDGIRKVIKNTGLGIGKNRSIIAHREIGHKSLNVNIKELGLSEIIVNNAELVRSVFEVPSEVYDAFTKNKTYENQKEATIGFYQDTIQPIADDIANTYNSFFELDNPIKASFSHLPVMQYTEDRKANKILKIAMAYEKLQRAGMSESNINELFTSQGLNSLSNE